MWPSSGDLQPHIKSSNPIIPHTVITISEKKSQLFDEKGMVCNRSKVGYRMSACNTAFKCVLAITLYLQHVRSITTYIYIIYYTNIFSFINLTTNDAMLDLFSDILKWFTIILNKTVSLFRAISECNFWDYVQQHT